MTVMMVSSVLLWVAVIALAVMLFALLRQIGVLHARIAPAGALMMDKGVAVNQPAPQLTAADRHGQPVNIGYQGERAQLLFFLSPTCPICKSLLPAVKSIERQHDEVDVVYVSDGEPELQEKIIAEFSLEASRYIIGSDVGMTLQVGKLPYAVLIDKQGVLKAKGLVNSREHLDSLFETLRLGSASIQEYIGKQQAALGSVNAAAGGKS